MEKIIGLKELRQNTEKYIQAVEKGKTFIIMRRSKPVFKLYPLDKEEQWETVVDITKIQKGGVPIKELLSRL